MSNKCSGLVVCGFVLLVFVIARCRDSVIMQSQKHIDLGNVCYEKGDYDNAIENFAEAIRLDPKNVLAYRNRGIAWEKKGEHDTATMDKAKAELLRAEQGK